MSDSKNALLFRMAGDEKFKEGDFDGAIDSYTESLDLYETGRAYFCRGSAYEQLGDYDSLIADLTRGLSLFNREGNKEDAANCLFFRAGTYYKKKDYDKAISGYTELIQFSESNNLSFDNLTFSLGDVHNDRGAAHFSKGNRSAAIYDFRKGADLGNSKAAGNLKKLENSSYGSSSSSRGGYSSSSSYSSSYSGRYHEPQGSVLGSVIFGLIVGGGISFTLLLLFALITRMTEETNLPLYVLSILTIVGFIPVFIAWRYQKIIMFIVLVAVALPGYLTLFGVIPDPTKAATVKTEQTAAPATATVKSDALNLRAEPSGDSQVLKVIPNAAVLTITGDPSNGWMPIEYEGVAGWVSAELITQ